MNETITVIGGIVAILGAIALWYLRQYGSRQVRIDDEIAKLQTERDQTAAQMDVVMRTKPFDPPEYDRLNMLRETLNRRIARLRSKQSNAPRCE